jgi:hypothetical protein
MQETGWEDRGLSRLPVKAWYLKLSDLKLFDAPRPYSGHFPALRKELDGGKVFNAVYALA